MYSVSQILGSSSATFQGTLRGNWTGHGPTTIQISIHTGGWHRRRQLNYFTMASPPKFNLYPETKILQNSHTHLHIGYSYFCPTKVEMRSCNKEMWLKSTLSGLLERRIYWSLTKSINFWQILKRMLSLGISIMDTSFQASGRQRSHLLEVGGWASPQSVPLCSLALVIPRRVPDLETVRSVWRRFPCQPFYSWGNTDHFLALESAVPK